MYLPINVSRVEGLTDGVRSLAKMLSYADRVANLRKQDLNILKMNRDMSSCTL